MAWVRFLQPYDFKATPAVTIAYKPGTYQVTSACATLAVAAGRAVRLKKTKKDEEPQEDVANDSIQNAAGAVSDNPDAGDHNIRCGVGS